MFIHETTTDKLLSKHLDTHSPMVIIANVKSIAMVKKNRYKKETEKIIIEQTSFFYLDTLFVVYTGNEL